MPSTKMLGTTEVVAFDRENADWGIFSNYAHTPINMPISVPPGNATFPTVEHYFQYMKDPTNANYLQLILSNANPQHARDEGGKHFDIIAKIDPRGAAFLRDNWYNGGADLAMKNAIDGKFDQNKAFRDELRRSENACLVEDTGSRSTTNQDGNWGWKRGGRIDMHPGAGNKLGILLMEKREQLHRRENRNDMLVGDPRNLSEDARLYMLAYHPNDTLIDLRLPPGPITKMRGGLNANSAPSPRTAHTANSMFKPKPRPDSPAVIKASGEIVESIKEASPNLALDDFIIRKGNLNNTFKVAFTSDDAAQRFISHLGSLGLLDANVSYFGDKPGGEKYPLDENGNFDQEGAYKYIVRFEFPQNALDYLNQISANDNDALYKEIMGKAPGVTLTP